MKLISVKTKELHKYITTKITFNDELSIITGVNGSGKTSILKLIESVLRLDIKKLNSTSFSVFQITLEFREKQYEILLEKKRPDIDTAMTFSVNGEKISIEAINKPKSLFGNRGAALTDFVETYEKKILNDDSSFNLFSKINPPLLIGLNRRVPRKRYASLEDNEIFDHHEYNPFEENEQNEIDSFDVALSDCKKLITSEFKRIKRYESIKINDLRNNIISSSFTYIDKFDDIVGIKSKMASRISEIRGRKNEILEVLNNIDSKDSSLSFMSASFFEKIETLYNKEIVNKSNDPDNLQFTFEYILNITQVERIFSLVKIIDKHKSELDFKRRKLDLFERVVNSFFEQTDKILIINSIGGIHVKIKDSSHKIEIDELSSGEKQLVIIIANMVFSTRYNMSNIIIDEPEISLHIKWQDMFISALREINTDIQMILATHSPDIIGDYDDCCTPIEKWS